MKKYSLFCLLALMVLALVSCGEDSKDGTENPGVIEPGEGQVVFGDDLNLDATEKSMTIVFDAAEAWSISTSTSWLSVDKKNGAAGRQTVALTVKPYTDVYESRTGELNLKVGANAPRVMKVIQAPTAKVMHLRTDILTYEYDKDATEIFATIKMVSNFAWKVKYYPKWMNEPVLTDIENGIATNLKDSTELMMTLNLDELTVKALEDSIVFVDPRDGDAAPTVCKLNVKFAGMGLSSITWEREAFQRTDPQEDLQFGAMFKGISNGKDGVKYTNDNYSIPVGGGGYPKKMDYLMFYIKTPIEFDYNTIEEAQQYFDVFALSSTVNSGYPDDNTSAPIKVELTDEWQYDKNPKYIRRYWKLSFANDNPSCLRSGYLMYVLPKGSRDKMFINGVFDKENFESEGKAFTHCGGKVSDSTFRVEGLTDVSYEVDLGDGLVVTEEGKGVYLGKGVSAKIEIYANDPYVLHESRISYYNGNALDPEKEWLNCTWKIDPNDSKHATATLSYLPNESDKTIAKTLKILFTGDSYPDGLVIQKELLVVYKTDAVSNLKRK